MAKEQSSYDNRAMQSGHPAGTSTCPNCNAPLYYAAELKLHDRTERNVVYCSGGCGWLGAFHADAKLNEQRNYTVVSADTGRGTTV